MMRFIVAVPAASALRTNPAAGVAPEAPVKNLTIEQVVNGIFDADGWTVALARQDVIDLCKDVNRYQFTDLNDSVPRSSVHCDKKSEDLDSHDGLMSLKKEWGRKIKKLFNQSFQDIIDYDFVSATAKSLQLIALFKKANVHHIEMPETELAETELANFKKATSEGHMRLLSRKKILLENELQRQGYHFQKYTKEGVIGWYKLIEQKLLNSAKVPVKNLTIEQVVNGIFDADRWTVALARQDVIDLCKDVNKYYFQFTDLTLLKKNLDCSKIEEEVKNLQKDELKPIKEKLGRPIKKVEQEHVFQSFYFTLSYQTYELRSATAKSLLLITDFKNAKINHIEMPETELARFEKATSEGHMSLFWREQYLENALQRQDRSDDLTRYMRHVTEDWMNAIDEKLQNSAEQAK